MRLKSFVLAVASTFLLSTTAFASSLSSGIDLYKSGQYDKAIEMLNKAVKEEPDNPEPHYWLSKAYQDTLQLEKVFPETKLFNDLKFKLAQKQKAAEEKAKAEAQAQNNQNISNNQVQQTDQDQLIYLTDSYLRQVIASRKTEDQIKNLKFLDYDVIKKLLSGIPSDSSELSRANSEYKLKANSGIATHQDMILLNKTNADLLSLTIDTKKYERDQETNPDLKKTKSDEIERLVKDYNNMISETVNLINQPVYSNTDPTSYDYYLAMETDADSYLKNLETKKSNIFLSITDITGVINSLKKSVFQEQKDLAAKKIDKKLLDADVSLLSAGDRELVSNYKTLNDDLTANKTKLFNFIKDQNILMAAYRNINNTIKKIKPDYVFKDPVLPKEEKLQEVPVEQPKSDVKTDSTTETKK